ncbi:MAG: undecaprenyl-diphosphate phosphatase [Planctomycetota bacterium]|jgi:undecaprenyl-diphosphatase
MTPLDAIILGLVEGITEYLPVSSTGHLILTSAFLGLDSPESKQAVDTFTIVVQGGAILAVLGLYRQRVGQMIRGLLGKDPVGRRLAINLIIAFIPAAVLGVLLNELIEARLFSVGPVLLALALGGIWMIWLGRGEGEKTLSPPTDIETMRWTTALMIGCLQVVAMWPGTSRSMMTIAGGTLLGLKPKQAAEFSFLLGLPTLGGACVYSLGKNVMASRNGQEQLFTEQLGLLPVVLGIGVATLSAALAVKWLVSFLTSHGLGAFGWYRLALCALIGTLWLAGIVSF